MMKLQINLLFSLLLFSFIVSGQVTKSEDYLLLITNTAKNECGYINQNGDTVIQPGKYNFCYTDTFRTYAIVANKNPDFVAVDRQQKVLYNVFPFDNGPDYASDGLFRIVQNNKIGYADFSTGKIIIKPQFACAFPFENGFAKVSFSCSTHQDGEHKVWTSDNWFYINKKGKKISLAQR